MTDEGPDAPRFREPALRSLWNREVTKTDKRVMLSILGAAYVVLISAAVWWAHHQGYGLAGYLGFITIAMVLVWALLWIALIGIAVMDFVKNR